MKRRFENCKSSPLIPIAIWLATGAIFWWDLLTFIELAVWDYYLIPVALTLFQWKPRMPLRVAAATSALALLGNFIGIGRGTAEVAHGYSAINRSMSAMAIWAVALMVRQLITVKLSLRERDWVQSGQAELGARIQGEHKPAELCDIILRFLGRYLEVPVAVMYAAEPQGPLRRQASYAMREPAALPETVLPGEGLLGQAVKERRVICLDELPQDYPSISSALGATAPRQLVIMPAEVDGAVRGVLELGFHHPVGRSDLDLLAAVAEPIAVAVRSAQYRQRLEQLLAATQRQAEELQAQQEELRASNEELDEQSRALEESQVRLEEQAQTVEGQRDEVFRAQQELVTKAEELSRVSRYKSEFLANMSHEMRTPLNSALILAKLLADNKDGTLTAEQVRYAEAIYSSGNDLLALINDILDLSRIEAGRMDLHIEDVEVAHVIASLRGTFEPVAAQKGLSFEVELAPEVPRQIASDGLRLQQIVRNLLSNAFKFTNAGSVGLRVFAGPDRGVWFSVTDTGIGIAQDQREAIFEAFYQASGPDQRRRSGTGLGLAISRELARRLGGDISVESAPGKGSTFTLGIPTAQAREVLQRAAPRSLASAPRAASLGPAHPAEAARGLEPRRPVVEDDSARMHPEDRSILIIEDDPAFARALRQLAHEHRFGALWAASAAEGVRLAEDFVPSAVLLDVHLPDDAALSVLAHVRRTATTRHIPVHVFSAVDQAQPAPEAGAGERALTPAKREELGEAIERLERRVEQKLRSVLVVEDSTAQRESIARLLEAESVSIVSDGSGQEALQRLRESPFDCMVLDLALPDMSGYDLLEKMASGEGFSFPPVIVYTGRELSHDEEDRLRRYGSSIIIKGPKSPERLLNEVKLLVHQVEENLSAEQKRIVREVRNREAALEGKSILIVDDDVRNVFALASLLENKGAKPRYARNGKEALAALEGAQATGQPGVDLVLMDIMMPEMDGLTATRNIRRRAEWTTLPIIALTAKAMSNDREECLRAGADDYIAKPFDIDRLLSLIKVWIPKGEAQRRPGRNRSP